MVLGVVRYVATLGDMGVPGMLSRSCGQGECCAAFRDDVIAPLPEGVRAVSVYSRSDGIVSWKACLDPQAEHVEVRSSHAACRCTATSTACSPRCLTTRARDGVDEPMDASFLHLEGAMNPMHVGGASIFEGPAPAFELLEEMVAGKLPLVPRYRQKCASSAGLGRPCGR